MPRSSTKLKFELVAKMKNKRREGPKGGVYNRDRTSEAKRLRVTVDARTTEQECEREELGKDEQIPMTRFRLGDDISVVDSSHGTQYVRLVLISCPEC